MASTIAFQHTQHLPRNLGVDVKGYSSEQYPQYPEDQLDYKLDCGFSLFHQKDSDALPENESIKCVLSAHAKAAYSCGQVGQILGEDFWKTIVANQTRWKGPLLFLKKDRFTKNRPSAPAYENFLLSDVKYAVLYLSFLTNLHQRG